MKTSIEIDFNNIDIFSTQSTMYQSSWEYQPWKSVKDNRRVVQTTRKKKKKKTVTIITVLVTTLVTFFSIQETFCYRKWQLRLVTPSKSELNEQKKVNKALPVCEIGFLRFIIIHVLLLALYSILFLCHSNFLRPYIHVLLYTKAKEEEK